MTAPKIVETEALKLFLASAPTALNDRPGRERKIALIDGEAGCGKTTAIHQLSQLMGLPFTCVALEPSSSDKNVIEQLHNELVKPQRSVRHLRRRDLSDQLQRVLGSDVRLVVIDEAQNASVNGLEMIRHLHMAPTATWKLVLSGVGMDRHLGRSKMLRSRIASTSVFAPLTSQQLIPVLRQIHPILDLTETHLLEAVDHAWGKGVLRNWSNMLDWLIELNVREGASADQLEQALYFVSGRKVRLPR